jgi:hypothetical protein
MDPQLRGFVRFTTEPETVFKDVKKARPGLCVERGKNGAVPSLIAWAGPGRVAPPFFLTRMENGATELAALCGNWMQIVAVRFRHRSWISFGQFWERIQVAVKQGLCWNRSMDDYWVET